MSISSLYANIVTLRAQKTALAALPVPPPGLSIAARIAILDAQITALIVSIPQLAVVDSTGDLVVLRDVTTLDEYTVPLTAIAPAPTPAPSGSVLQYAKQIGAAVDFTVNAAAYADTGFSVVLPGVLADAANLVRVRAQFALYFGFNQPGHLFNFSLKRGAVDISPVAQACIVGIQENGGGNNEIRMVNFEWYDAPGAVGINTYHLIAHSDTIGADIIGSSVPVLMSAEEIKA